MSEELATLKYKKRMMEDDLETKIKSYKEAVKQFKERDRKLVQDKHKFEEKISAMHQLIELEQRMQAVIVRKIDVVEKNFAKCEQFIISLDTFLATARSKINSQNQPSHFMGSNFGGAAQSNDDMAFLDSQKN